MSAEHMRPEGLSQGYYCFRCGGVTNMYATGHGVGSCQFMPDLVNQFRKLNEWKPPKKRLSHRRCDRIVNLGKRERHDAHQFTVIEDLDNGRQFNTYVCLGRDHYNV